MNATEKALWNAAHTLRDNRITYGEAIANYGKRVVHRMMNAGWLYLEGVGGPNGAAFDPKNATEQTRLYANATQVA